VRLIVDGIAVCEIDWMIALAPMEGFDYSRGSGMVYSYWKDWGEIVAVVSSVMRAL
jgi:hypothetical protein